MRQSRRICGVLALTAVPQAVLSSVLCRGLFAQPSSFSNRSGYGVTLESLALQAPRAIQARRGEGRFIQLEPRLRPIERISVVVPVYRELINGNLLGLLESLRTQDIDPRIVHLVLVVNNSPQLARNPNHPIARENQETLWRLGRYRSQIPFLPFVF